MIKQLELKNFQSHKDNTLQFEPGVNVIIGQSDSGKTSIIRALRWLTWYQPLGDNFISNWADEAEVKLTTAEHQISLLKGKDTQYSLSSVDSDQDPLIFKAFGTKVPKEVQEALNFSEINIQEQMDAPFLLSNSSGEVSRHFNKIANIDTIDSSLRNIESWVRSINNDKKAAEKEIERHKENLQEFDYLNKLEAEIEVLENLENRKNSRIKKSGQINDLICKIEETVQNITEKSGLIPAHPLVVSILKGMKKRSKQIKKFKQLKKLVFDIVDAKDELEKFKELTYTENPVQNILDLYEEEKELQNKIDFLIVTLDKIEETTTHIERADNKLDKLEEKWHKNMPEVCPLCGK